MLVSPLLPSPRFDEGTSYRPAKDLDAFNKLLPPPVEFVEGSSSGLLAVAEGKYPAINEPPKSTTATDVSAVVMHAPSDSHPSTQSHEQKRSISVASTKTAKASSSAPSSVKILPDVPIDTTWPSGVTVGTGLNNTGNTCFLNSALQCLLHTPPLLHVLSKHSKSDPSPKNSYCMACALRQVMYEAFNKPHSITPYPVITKLQAIAKHMRRGRQEDSHEFLRYFIDALQKSSLAGIPGKVDPKVAEKTWVYRIFGGLLRSRVKCLSCGHNSDTYDRMLDLSVDIAGVSTLKDALRKFVAVDHLRGADKYKCEKCKKPVNADKQFTIDEAPLVLTLHLKRFSPMGRKIPHAVAYQERLTLQPYMSEGKFGPSYTLYGVISHAGSGPNSGHYYAHVKGANGSWYEMNDDSVMRQSSAPTSMRSAYMLFYIREKGQALEAAVKENAAAATATATSVSTPPPVPHKTGLVANMKKRKVVESDEEDERPKAAKTPRKFIGPRLPTPPPQVPPKDTPQAVDPQAETLKKKIAAAASQQAKGVLQSLDQYGDDDDDDDMGEKVPSTTDNAPADAPAATPPSPLTQNARDPATLSSPSPAAANPATSAAEKPIPPSSFYGTPAPKRNEKKRKSPDGDDEDASYTQWARTPISPPASSKKERRNGSGNPFSRLKGGNNLKERRESCGPNSPAARFRKKRFLM
ncbi:cysteine proteinase [Pilatotrama ljubarskyi]|nr:cysteine proteinase [Pilatotrama ljubarskyi]